MEGLIASPDKKEPKMETMEKCCWKGNIGQLLDMDRKEFMSAMLKGAKNLLPGPVETSQRKSWRDEFKVLKYDTFGSFKKSELERWRNLEIVFEMELPNRKRPDAVIFARNMVVVLEFKRMEKDFDGFIKQVKSYCRSLRRLESLGKNRKVKGILIYTKMEKCHDIAKVQVCSKDRLASALQHLLGGYPVKE